jgi:uncharacterized membrane protein
VRTAFAVAFGLHLTAVAWAASRLPLRVPVHWGAGGAPDQWGSRSEFVLSAALAGALVGALSVGAALLLRRVSVQSVRVPFAEHWTSPAHEGELRDRLERDALWLGTATLLMITIATLFAVEAATSARQRLSPWVVVVLVGYLLAVTARCVWSSLVGYRPAPDPAVSPRR